MRDLPKGQTGSDKLFELGKLLLGPSHRHPIAIR